MVNYRVTVGLRHVIPCMLRHVETCSVSSSIEMHTLSPGAVAGITVGVGVGVGVLCAIIVLIVITIIWLNEKKVSKLRIAYPHYRLLLFYTSPRQNSQQLCTVSVYCKAQQMW